jgi:predicted DNA-binding antitoxin AbrB/MazE fold protein
MRSAAMQETIRAIITEGKIQPLEELSIPEGTEILVTISTNGEFWLNASQSSLDSIWNNAEDDVYAELLER